MRGYRIMSKAWVDFGFYQGRTEAEALANMHKDAGYQVEYHEYSDSLIFKRPDDEEVCGNVDDWEFKQEEM